ncbi:MAG: MBL fold metallo-hydrolase, partial [Magnetospiraceae bacterium]
MKIQILGCGPSGGIPGVSYGWGRCDPNNPKNRRLRPSILVEHENTKVLVDTSPDLRAQLLTADIRHLDAVLYTHHHADHVHGIDDLRPINRLLNAPLDCYADAATLNFLQARFGYVFEPLAEGATLYYKPTLLAHEIAHGTRFTVGDVPVQAFDQDHGYCRSMGF